MSISKYVKEYREGLSSGIQQTNPYQEGTEQYKYFELGCLDNENGELSVPTELLNQ